MKSFRTDPRNHAAEGDERIRTAPGTDSVYEDRPCRCERLGLDPVAFECLGPNTCIDRWRETVYGDRLDTDEDDRAA